MKLFEIIAQWVCQFPLRGRYRVVGALPLGGQRDLHVGDNRLTIDVSQPFMRLMYFRLYEEGFIWFLRRHLRHGDVVIDAGANIGYVSAVASSLVGQNGTVYSIEPSVTCMERLAKNLTAANIRLIHAALGDTRRIATFFDTPRVLSRGFACLGEIEAPEDGTAYNVEVTTVDHVMEAHGITRARMLKLDIEEAELLAIKGASNALGNRAIDYVLVETDFSHPRAAAVYDELTGHGYLPHLLTGRGGVRRLDYANPGRARSDVMWLAANLATQTSLSAG